ncbi:MAG TPA: diacylglycerol kinase family protein [Steroidobacteraceae bacterium]|nr:diacylglycerol kinase family protein [Steroidobacteraceae bacterium]
MSHLSARPLFIVLNAVSGGEDGDASASTIAGVLQQAGREHEIRRVDDARQLDETAARAVEDAQSAAGIVVAAGGDGTLNAVARAVLGSRVPYGVIPQGTFNYFARSHGIPTDTTEATLALLDARIERVPVGLINGRPFLVNASLGLYPESLEVREEQKQRHGRSRPVALWATLLTVLREHRPMRIRLERDGRPVELCTLTLFVGLNGLQLEQMGWDGTVVEEGKLAAIVLKPVSSVRLLWLMARGALGRLAQAHGVDSFAFSSLTVRPANRSVQSVKVATDGETTTLRPPLEFSLAAEPLLLLTPRTEVKQGNGT